MGYNQRRAKGLRNALQIDCGGWSGEYDIDELGHDDGRDAGPDHSFRLVFGLGRAVMIHHYIVGMRRPGDERFFQSFWLSDCAVAHVDEEELGPPRRVEGGPVPVPVVFGTVEIAIGGHTRRFAIEECVFEARKPDAEQTLVFTWRLGSSFRSAPTELRFCHPGGWQLVEGHGVETLGPGDHVHFSDPVHDPKPPPPRRAS